MIDYSTPDIVLISRENKNSTCNRYRFPLIHNLPRTEAEKIMKYGKLALEIKNVWKLNMSMYPEAFQQE